ncbi:CPI_1c_G0009260.mRNA.1.CDS.1 [Saccharomyces cerevisiae]|nr:CPI_1c_G0009260.mRNA.1.CDS.1 [Saccharomyces cerevisiae]CAI7197925.1 CPI_1c_G0009260.mRNA.1.CDS.1 [Saccharomyces cerevisiae]
MGTTLATNCALERNGEPCALVTTKGFKDVMVIGDQTRPDIFNLHIEKPRPLYDVVVEVDERVTLEDFTEDPNHHISEPSTGRKTVYGNSGEVVRILKTPDVSEITRLLQSVYQRGLRSIAIAFLHSYTYPHHEQIVGRIAHKIGFKHVSLSSEVSPMIKHLPRAHSSVADAYLTPVIKKYLQSIQAGLVNTENTNIQFMQSDGGLVEGHRFSGLKSILSGPAGDVSRFGEGKLEHVFETTTAGIVIQSPQLNVNTVAAGGSSRLFWENGLFRVGPDSATADPGPTAYRKGGPLTITDANLLLGQRQFKELTETINKDLDVKMSPAEVAFGFLKVANESMARSIRAITEAKGHVVSDHRLVTFGGAGGQHAVAVAESLGINEILAHRYSSILSAYGIFLADVVEEKQEPCFLNLNDPDDAKSARKKTRSIGKNMQRIYLNLRYEGTETSLMILEQNENWEFEKWFAEAHKREFGFAFSEKCVIVDDVRVRATAKSCVRDEEPVDEQLKRYKPRSVFAAKKKLASSKMYILTTDG